MENYLGEIRVFAGNFAPADWAFCQGQLLQISEYDVLFSLLGTTYGGDGMQTFGLPSLQSRVVVGMGASPYAVGTPMGTESVSLTAAQLPAHQHVLAGAASVLTGVRGQTSPTNALFGDQGGNAYDPAASATALAPNAIKGETSVVGQGNAHSNVQPVQALNYIIALQGIYPPQS